MSTLTNIADTIGTAAPDLTDAQREALVLALTEREDNMAAMFHMAGMQFGLYPQIIAEVFAEVGVGTPISDQQRDMVRQGFNNLMDELRRAHEEGQS